MQRTKRCTKCGIEKTLDDFSKNKAMRDGLQGYCKLCQQEEIKIWRENNADYRKQYGAQYRTTHREKRRLYNQQWRKRNEGYWHNYQNERLRTDIDYRLRNYISRAIRRAIRKNRKSAFTILGYTIEDLRQHLESLFQDGMSWQNYGTHWHIDHVIPQSWFHLSHESGIDEYELKLCWSLSNLQPMWANENLEKKNAHIYHIKLGQLRLTYEQFRIIIERNKRGDSVLMF